MQSAVGNGPVIPPPPPARSVNRSCSVFVGNIPYEATEDELRSIFSRVGPVVSIRLMYDKETRQPKGFGFIEYRDIETAYSCMRILNDVEYGGRPMRIDWADHELRSAEAVQKVLRTSGTEVSERTEKIVAEKLQEFRGKISDEMMEVVNDDMRGYREIEQIMDNLSKDQLVLLLAEIKRLALNSPEVARAFLESNPQVKVAALCALSRVSVSSDLFHPPTAQELAIARQKARVILPGRQTAVASNPV
jgi:cleavage stimulation factor subunit 2